MSEVEAGIEVGAPVADAWSFYFDADRWPSWVDQFARVVSSDGYPGVGGALVWESNPAGRGRVAERVLAHEDRRLHIVDFEDPATTGTLEVRFEMVAAADSDRTTRVTQKLVYELRDGGPVGKLTDRLFIRGQMRQSLQRSLTDFRTELTAAGAG
jgi:hypothetical protein